MGKVQYANTVNGAKGCQKVSEECRNCFMYRLSHVKYNEFDPYSMNPTPREIVKRRIADTPSPIFFNDLTDTFWNKIPEDLRNYWFDLFAEFPTKQFLILTKRAEDMVEYFRKRKCPDNVWLGVSCGGQQWVKRVDILRDISCKWKWISFEPLIEPILSVDLTGINWIVIGGETISPYEHDVEGVKPRPIHLPTVDMLLHDAKRLGIPAFFKQIGGVGRDGAGGEVLPDGRVIRDKPLLLEGQRGRKEREIAAERSKHADLTAFS